MATVNLSPSGDTFINSANATTNQDGNDNMDVGEVVGGSDVRRGLIKFDLSSIPSNATVSSATLKIWDRGTDLSNNTRVLGAYRVLRSWTTNQTTWNKADSGNNWGTAGCSNTTTDREATDIGTVSITNPEVAGEYDITLTASKVQEWISGALTNNGILLQKATETDDLTRFNSSEWSSSSERPILSITYSVGGGEFFALL